MGRFTSLLLVIASIGSVLSESEEGLQSFYDHDIVPTVLSEAPANLLTVTFTNTNVKVLEGNVVKDVTKLISAPEFQFEDVDPATNYTLMEIDPDTPSRESKKKFTFLLWMKVNIPGSNLKGGKIATKFLNPVPTPGTGYHRYIFLLYEQTTNVVVNKALQQTINRLNFSPEKFADNNDLGALVAGNFFQAGSSRY